VISANAQNAAQVEQGDGFTLWLARAKGGCRESLGHLLDDCDAYLRSVIEARRVRGGRCDAATRLDHLQETKLRAVRDFVAFRGTTTAELHAWLRCILLHCMAEYQLKESHQPRCLPPECEPADASTPLRLAREETDDELRCALPHLAADHQEVLRLRYWERLPWHSVGKRMHRSADAARMLHLRAVHALARFCTRLERHARSS